jgi:hypothetical protein
MGLSLISALKIQTNETLVDFYKDKESEKYGYAITHDEKKYCSPIISCNPVYDSQADALTAGNKLRKQIKALNLNLQKKSIVDAVGGEETTKTINKIVEISKNDKK